nr:agmatine deiminase family protein [uncultured Desulfobulbus sp.]
MKRRLPAEWEPQDGILLSWPHRDTDWAPYLQHVWQVFLEITQTISRFEQVVIVTPDPHLVQDQLCQAGIQPAPITLVQVATNDTWTRDFGPITVLEDAHPCLLDFGFNGWGLKFAADLDNQITAHLAAEGLWGKTPLQVPGLILEGGSIESDGAGTLLTTSECLLGPNRNPHLNKAQLEQALSHHLGISHFLWLDHGFLAGDDTDSHIDTLARLCPKETILYVRCPDQTDSHYGALQQMEAELQKLKTPKGQPYRLVPLPWPRPCYHEDGHRLPATYANFLIINGAVLVPTYDDPQDQIALATIAQVFPDREIIGIDCRPLILQHGSLHCVTMQLPRGVLS